MIGLKNALQGKAWIAIGTTAVGTTAGYFAGGLAGALKGGSLGLAFGYAAGKLFFGPATQASINNELKHCLAIVDAQRCADRNGRCAGFFGGLGAPRE